MNKENKSGQKANKLFLILLLIYLLCSSVNKTNCKEDPNRPKNVMVIPIELAKACKESLASIRSLKVKSPNFSMTDTILQISDTEKYFVSRQLDIRKIKNEIIRKVQKEKKKQFSVIKQPSMISLLLLKVELMDPSKIALWVYHLNHAGNHL